MAGNHQHAIAQDTQMSFMKTFRWDVFWVFGVPDGEAPPAQKP
jgi:hypothetical protein